MATEDSRGNRWLKSLVNLVPYVGEHFYPNDEPPNEHATSTTATSITTTITTDDTTSSTCNSISSPANIPEPITIQRLTLPPTRCEKTHTTIDSCVESVISSRNTRDVGVVTEVKATATDVSRDDTQFKGEGSRKRSLLWSDSDFINSRNISSSSLSPRSFNNSFSRGMRSPYYEGKITFGGTSAKRARLVPSSILSLSTNPPASGSVGAFNSNIHTVTKPRMNDISGNAKKKLNNNEDLTDAAKRILASIESVSSPLEDAKKIPFYGQIDHNKYLINSKRSLTSTLPYSRPTKISSPLIPNLSSMRSLDKQTLKWSSLRSGPTISSVSSNTAPSKSDTNNSSRLGGNLSAPNWARNSGTEISTGGKIRGRLPGRLRPPRDVLEDRLPPLDLPAVPLNITSLPKFHFASDRSKINHEPESWSSVSSGLKASSPCQRVSLSTASSKNNTGSPTLRFKDSVPSQFKSVGVTTKPTTIIEVISNETDVEMDSEFTFSEPTPKDQQLSEPNLITDTERKNETKSVSSDTKTVPNITSNSMNQKILQTRNRINADAALEALDDVQEVKSSESPMKTSEMMESASTNQSSEQNNSSTPKQNQEKESQLRSPPLPQSSPLLSKKETQVEETKASENLMDKFKPAPGSWDCGVCMVPNKAKDIKCVACETPKPGVEVPISKPLFNFGFNPVTPATTPPKSSPLPSIKSSFSDFSSSIMPTSSTLNPLVSKANEVSTSLVSATVSPTAAVSKTSNSIFSSSNLNRVSGSGSVFNVVAPSISSSPTTHTISSLPARPQTSISTSSVCEIKSSVAPAPSAAPKPPVFSFGQPVTSPATATATPSSSGFTFGQSSGLSNTLENKSLAAVSSASNSSIFGSSIKSSPSFMSTQTTTAVTASGFGQLSSPFSSLTNTPQSGAQAPSMKTSSFSLPTASDQAQPSESGALAPFGKIASSNQKPNFSFTSPLQSTQNPAKFDPNPLATTSASASASGPASSQTISSPSFSYNLKTGDSIAPSLPKPQTTTSGFQFEMKTPNFSFGNSLQAASDSASTNGFDFAGARTTPSFEMTRSNLTTSTSKITSPPSHNFAFGNTSNATPSPIAANPVFGGFGTNPSQPSIGNNFNFSAAASNAPTNSVFGATSFGNTPNTLQQTSASTSFQFNSSTSYTQANGGSNSFNPTPTFNFASTPQVGPQPFQFNSKTDPTSVAIAPNRKNLKAKRRLG
ncbi:uncharacterized protein LOC141858136 [Brevipalpus obovatus]|uniref:uncharacterized protein LOC141858136 n=1 Tax=Brevipalpus obovatus TaxID=246614 RepID=UPI003D9E0412